MKLAALKLHSRFLGADRRSSKESWQLQIRAGSSVSKLLENSSRSASRNCKFFAQISLEELLGSASFSVKPETGTGSLINELAALVKGFVPNCGPDDFLADPENACLRHAGFLKLWLQKKSLSKPDERKAFLKACPKLST